MKYLCGIVLFVALLAISVRPSEEACGYEACPKTKTNMINIHMVPHSHDDVGWLKTVDQYFYGHRSNIQHAGVQYIIDTVIAELIKDPARRFIQVETSFFAKWWAEQSETAKQVVRKLVNEGRLEFTGGAWSMNDEAAVNYQSVIDQFTLGLKFLDDTFGSCARPRIGWQIDPFGHSREQASIFAQMGYDGEFFARMDHRDKNDRIDNLGMEMIWDASDSLSNDEIFTGLLYRHYSAPPGYCFDVHCGDDPIIDTKSYDNNVKSRVDDFLSYVTSVAQHYRSNHIMIPMGDDFQYEDAQVNFKNMDKLIKYVNERQAEGSTFNLFYSTPACYLNSLHEGLQTWPNKTQDFFPYGSDDNSYWTGYFTSRPTQKRFERDGNHILQVAKQLSVFAELNTKQQKEDLEYLREIMGVMQHHDAITGTEKQHVSDDYDRILYDAILGGVNTARDGLRKLTNLPNGEFESCLQLNISECAFTKDDADNVVVTLYNPLAHTSTQYVRVPVKNENYEVTDEKGRVVASEVVPVAWQVLALEFRNNDTQHELVFKASVDKIANYYIKKVASQETKNVAAHTKSKRSIKAEEANLEVPKRFKKVHSLKNATETFDDDEGETVVQTSQVKLVIDNKTGLLKTVEMNGVSENIDQSYGVYRTYDSGAYVFRQYHQADFIVQYEGVEFTVYDGALVKEVHQQFSEYISQVIRIYEGKNLVEIEWQVGPIEREEEFGREVVIIFNSTIASDGVSYTDSNGREMIKRVKDQRETFTPGLDRQPTAANYYPVTSRIALQDSKKRIAVLNDRAQGGASMLNGQLELMLHRRLVRDDGYGVGEALNEEKYGQPMIARGKVYLILSPSDESTAAEREAEKEIHLPFWKFFSKNTGSTTAAAKSVPSFNDFPKSVHLLTLEPFNDDEVLLRVENFLDHTEGQVVSFNIRPIFDYLNGVEIRETTLDGNLPLSDMKRFKFHHDSSGQKPDAVEYFTSAHKPLAAEQSQEASEFSVTLHPMQIRTFIIKTE
uniref:Alpha-mannosidase n=2 Tax=Drosophila melanogaster TaxID=7227 RepID=Q9VLH9_DROME|nr:lysosomal alpha-mannosidase VI [Drosophila melanogaster]AAF52711.2 lysosomal alpha-mannosidase VI [Drosophila melanogaster]|eukprot:NP_609253.1 lysosomal alpha-mannosidase VI [Drosophila melanogaster]